MCAVDDMNSIESKQSFHTPTYIKHSFSQYKDQNRLGLQQLQLKLESDHRCTAELIRKSLMAASEQSKLTVPNC